MFGTSGRETADAPSKISMARSLRQLQGRPAGDAIYATGEVWRAANRVHAVFRTASPAQQSLDGQ
jgi:hypothetical protein